MQTLRKVFAISVIFVTVLSMSVVVGPSASAAASAGDLIKMSGLSSVYYLAGDGKRYVFPNESTYFSWYSDFSSVMTIPQSELEGYPLGANVTVRPGTKLIKITTNPNVFAVEPGGVLRKITSEAQAITLFGANWAKRVVDVSDAFWGNYKSGTDLPSGVYPIGTLLKSASAPAVVYYDGTNYRSVASEAAFNANRFNWNNIITTTMAFVAGGTALSGGESTLSDTSSGAGGMIYAGGSGLTVALSSDTAASQSVPKYSTIVPFVSVAMTASNDGAVTVNDITFTRGGTGVTSEFDGGYLFVGENRVSGKRSVSSSDNKITFSTIGLSIPAGTTKVVTLRMNGNTTTPGTGNHNFRITAASDIASGATVSGSFPITGNTMIYSSVAAATVTLTAVSAATSYKVGENNVVMGEFSVANNSVEDVNITHLKLKQNGDASNGAVGSFSLEVDGAKVKEGVAMVDKYVDFILPTPYLLKKSRTATLTVRGNVVTDIGKTVDLYLNNVADFDARGTAYGNFYGALLAGNVSTGTTLGIVTIKGSAINVSFDGPTSSDVKKNTTNYTFVNFKMSSVNEDVNLEALKLTLVTSAASSSQTLRNVKIVDVGNNVSYGVTSDPAGGGTSETLTFENVYLKKGVQYTFAVKGDIPDQTWSFSGYTYQVNWTYSVGTVGRYVTSDKLAIVTDFSASSATGQVFTVADPKATFSKVPTSAATYVKSAPKALLYKFQVSANNVSDLKVTKVTVATSTGTLLATMADAFDRVYLYSVSSDGAETFLDDETTLSTTYVTFSGFTLNVAKGVNNQVTLVVRGDVKSSPTAGTIAFALSSTKSQYLIRDADSNNLADSQIDLTAGGTGHTSTIATVGTYTVDFDTSEADTNALKNVLGGTKVLVGRIKLTAQKEVAVVKKLALANFGTTPGDNGDVTTLQLYKEKAGTTLLGTANLGADRYAQFDITGSPIEVSVSGTTYLYVYTNVKGVDYSASPAPDSTATAGRTVTLEATSTTAYPTEVFGKNTGTKLSNSSLGTTKAKAGTIMGAVMSNITTSYAEAVLSSGVKDIFSFKVTAPASSNMALDGSPLGFKLATTTFSIATSSGIVLSAFKVRRNLGGNGEQTCGGSAVLGGGTIAIGFQNCYGAGTDLIVKPGETAEFVIAATAAVTGTAQSMQVTIETVDTNVKYFHDTTVGAVTADVNPYLSGISAVRGGSLKN